VGGRWERRKRRAVVVRERGCPEVTIYPHRSGFRGAVRIDGRRRMWSLKCHTLYEAREKAVEFARRLGAGDTSFLRPRTAPDVRKVLEEYRATVLHVLRRETVDIYVAQVKRFLSWARPQALADITRPQIEQWKVSLFERGLSPRTVDSHVAGLSAFLSFCVRTGRLAENPAHGVRRENRRRRGLPRFHPKERIKALLTAAKGSRWELPVALAYYCGLRRGEVAHLEWDDVGHDCIVVQAHGDWQPKDYESRRIPIPGELRPILERWRRPAGRVWDSMPYNIDRDWRTWRARHGFSDVNLHDLRHSYGTHLAAAGVPARKIQEWMGHASITTTEIYMHAAPGRDGDVETLSLEEDIP